MMGNTNGFGLIEMKLQIGKSYDIIDEREFFIKPGDEKYFQMLTFLQNIDPYATHWDYYFWPAKVLFGKAVLLVDIEMNGPNKLYKLLCENKIYYAPTVSERKSYKEIE